MTQPAPTSYSRRRKIVQAAFLLALLAFPLRLVGFNRHTLHFFVLHWTLPLQKVYWPLMLILLVFIVLMIFSIRHGRIFCSWFCPMHYYLEHTNDGSPRKGRRFLLALLFATLGTEVVFSFFLSIPDQWTLLRTSDRALLLGGAMTAVWVGLFTLFNFYREGFCQQACPYALVQLLLQSGNTRMMRFQDPDRRCIHCNRCDHSCPQNLKARFECSQRHCTNCSRCAEACHCVLGQNKGLFRLESDHGSQITNHSKR
ncbi:4Fe-4S binding protein [Planctomycetota bacterium]